MYGNYPRRVTRKREMENTCPANPDAVRALKEGKMSMLPQERGQESVVGRTVVPEPGLGLQPSRVVSSWKKTSSWMLWLK